MHLTLTFRFRGYWLGLFSWLVLTFASPLSSAVAYSDQGWMALCSTYGVHWVQVADSDPTAKSSGCQCLAQALAVSHPGVPSPDVFTFSLPEAIYKSPLVNTYYVLPPSRAPPSPRRGEFKTLTES